MDFSRIKSVIDVGRMQRSRVTLIGCGGGAGLAKNLIRCGLGEIDLVDFDVVGPENMCRQDHMEDHIGISKVDALAKELLRINPGELGLMGCSLTPLGAVEVKTYTKDFCSFTDEEIDHHFRKTDVFVSAVDRHPPAARMNEVVQRLKKRGVWIGLYPSGRAGEVAFWKPGLGSCYRCLCSARYAAFEKGDLKALPSEGADVLAVTYLDSLAAMVVIGLLTEGADNRYGRLISQLGDRNFLQVKIDPEWNFGGVDPVAKELGIQGTSAYMGFCTAARRDPDPGGQCPDCLKYRGEVAA